MTRERTHSDFEFRISDFTFVNGGKSLMKYPRKCSLITIALLVVLALAAGPAAAQ